MAKVQNRKRIYKLQFKNFPHQNWDVEPFMDEEALIESWEPVQTSMTENTVFSSVLATDERMKFPKQTLRYVKKKGWELEVWAQELAETIEH